MTAVSIRVAEDVIEDLKKVAPELGFSGDQPLIRAYVGQGYAEGPGAVGAGFGGSFNGESAAAGSCG